MRTGEKVAAKVAGFLRRLADRIEPVPESARKRPFRRLSLVTVVGRKQQERISRRLAKYRESGDARDAAVRWGQRQCVYRSLDLLRSESRDYFIFEESENERGDIIVRSTLKVLKDD